MAALAPAYPPDSGEPRSAAPLDKEITTLPGASGASSASRVQPNACRTSTCQLRPNVSQVCCWIGRGSGGGARVQHQDAGPAGVDEPPGHVRVGGVGGHRGERAADFGAQLVQRAAVAGHPGDLRARPGQGGGDAPAEAPAGPGDQRRFTC